MLVDEIRPFASIRAQPLAQLARLKHLMLLWPEQQAEPLEAIDDGSEIQLSQRND